MYWDGVCAVVRIRGTFSSPSSAGDWFAVVCGPKAQPALARASGPASRRRLHSVFLKPNGALCPVGHRHSPAPLGLLDFFVRQIPGAAPTLCPWLTQVGPLAHKRMSEPGDWPTSECPCEAGGPQGDARARRVENAVLPSLLHFGTGLSSTPPRSRRLPLIGPDERKMIC